MPSLCFCSFLFTRYYLIIVLIIFNLIHGYSATNSDKGLPNEIDFYTYPKSEELTSSDPAPIPPGPGWIDPYDMFGETPRRNPNTLNTISDVAMDQLEKRVKLCELHWQRIVNTLLKAIDRKEHTVGIHSVRSIKLEYLVFENDYNLLKKFVNNGGTSEGLREVSGTLMKIFSQINSQNHFTNNSQEMSIDSVLKGLKGAVAKIASSPEWLVVISVVLLLAMTLWFVFITHSYRFAIFTALLTLFFAGFGFTWMRMYEEKEAEKFAHYMVHGRQAPYHCRGFDMPWYEYMFYRMFGTDCYEFFKIREVRSIVKVSPTEVLSETLSSFIISPMKNAGLAYSAFISSVLNNVPWYLKPLAIPFCFFMPLVFIIIVIALMCDYKLSIGITGIHLLPSWGARGCSPCRRAGGYVEDVSRTKITTTESNDGNMVMIHLNQLYKLLKNEYEVGNALTDKPENDSGHENKISGNKPSKEENSNQPKEQKTIKSKTKDDPGEVVNCCDTVECTVAEEGTPDENETKIKKRTRSVLTISSNCASCSSSIHSVSGDKRHDCNSDDQVKKYSCEDSKTK